MFSVRLEKLKFLVEELQIALHLSSHLNEPFTARTLARHILIRARDFIEHARALRKPLNVAGYDTQIFHEAKEAYASAFDEYFQESRDRLGAHIQDLDFGRRIELWNDIEIVKISYFVEGAREIYRHLEPLHIPGYVMYSTPLELSDSDLLERLKKFQRTLDGRHWIEIGSDSLALARNNTIAGLSTNPVHARAAQLALIRRWIALGRALLDELKAHPRVGHILKARLVTDLVSFCDCLVTRPLPAGAPQLLDGLNKLITTNGQSAAPIDTLVTVSHFDVELQKARAIRDTVGAHLEVDGALTLAQLISALETYDLPAGLDFYERASAAFIKTCKGILYLRAYAVDGERLYGAAVGSAAAALYSGSKIAIQTTDAELTDIDDENEYRKNLIRWFDGDARQKADARDFFWRAFSASQVFEKLEEGENLGTGKRITHHEFRKAHQFLYSVLTDDLSDSDFQAVLELILSCRSGWPYPLAEVLVRRSRHSSVFRQWSICRCLGELGSAPHGSVDILLDMLRQSPSEAIRLQAAFARYIIFAKREGLFRLNNGGNAKSDYDAVVQSLVAPMRDSERLIFLLACASALSGRTIGGLSQPFRKNYDELQIQIEALCVPFLEDDEQGSKKASLRKLIETNDYVGVCVLLALDLEGGDDHPIRSELLDSCCNGLIAIAGHSQSERHLAMCFLIKKEHRKAFEIASGIASRNPEWVDVQILLAEILGEIPGAEGEGTQKTASIRRAYKLTPDQEARLARVDKGLLDREQAASKGAAH